MYINHFAVLSCGVLSLILGGLWYSPMMFYKSWLAESGVSEEKIKETNPAKIYIITFVLSVIISYNLAFFLGDANTTWQWGMQAGCLAGLGWASLIFIIIALFEQKSFKYMLINCGYITVYFTLAGFILGIWR